MHERVPAALPDRFLDIETTQALAPAERQVRAQLLARRGRLPAPYALLVLAPELAQAYEACSAALHAGRLPASVIEMVFLFEARLQQCRYLWANHVDRAVKAGLSGAVMASLARGDTGAPADAGPAIACAWRFARALRHEHRIADADYHGAVQCFGRGGVVELTALCGYAATIGMLLNVRQPTLPQGVIVPF
ncbi:MAG: hypothetical protein GAK30_03500 [Paracidovorax wautersii]|uniref:Alkylhydroperoxidase family enzyme, contains CxxC motif n=1 Tax=Paracidovorax wautersii TaxID=1177982 RepID=A0A7V8JP26_9BURK|nr:MAG: hypothetical protein GAK30_03500 [Paracidovorax wautersii]